jgi:hypothetical protein
MNAERKREKLKKNIFFFQIYHKWGKMRVKEFTEFTKRVKKGVGSIINTHSM